MTTVVEIEGNTVDEAIEAALTQLGVDRKNAKIEVIEEKNKGFLGRLGGGKAKVRVSVIEESGVDKTIALVRQIMEQMGIRGEVETIEEDDGITLNITGDDLGILIGKHGETLSAIQTIANVAIKKAGVDRKLIIDVEHYRRRRVENIVETAKQVAERVGRTGRPELLKPMNAYDRRMIHVALQDHDKVYTLSEGEDPERKVKVMPR